MTQPDKTRFIINARVLGADANPAPQPFTLAFAGGKITATGAEAERLRSDNSEVYDAKGAILLPGFVESHVHLFTGGVSLDQLFVGQVTSESDLRSEILKFATSQPGHHMLCAYGANYTMLGNNRRITRRDLDKIIKDRPLVVTSTDFHCAWANTLALQNAGVYSDSNAHDLEGVMRDEAGTATGELREFAAMSRVKNLSATGGREELGLSGLEPENVSLAQREADKAALQKAFEYCLQHGITSAVNMDGNLYLADLLQELDNAGEIPLRVSLPMTITQSQSAERRIELLQRAQTPPGRMLSFGRVKMFMDGVFDSWTAHVVGDYPDRRGFSGEPLFTRENFNEICISADALGLQICVHAVGDGAVRRVLDGYEAANKANGCRDARHRIEHIDTYHPVDLARMRDLAVVASMQPVHPPGSAGLPLEPTISLMGEKRWPYAFAWRDIAAAGIPLAFGTDWPVSPLSPLHAIHCALSRKPWAKHIPDQRIPLADCLKAYASGGHHPLFEDKRRGQLIPGHDADIILLKGDIGALASNAQALNVTATFVAGRLCK
jgi:predicted amidohydrolase YtcJ